MAEPLEFFKMSGAGNDFIVADNRQGHWNAHPLDRLARGLCRRGLSVGADGLILLENSNRASVRLRIFNSDGSDGVMCGNGARCAARLAFIKVVAGRRMTLETGAGVVGAEILADGRVRVEVPGTREAPQLLQLSAEGRTIPAYLTWSGVPHLVVFAKDVAAAPVASLGARLRRSPESGPGGANVNFVSLGSEPFPIRTYERGVEGETLACGTGAAAAAWVLHRTGQAGATVRLMPRSGKELVVEIGPERATANPFRLVGEARLVLRGYLADESLQEALTC